MFNIDLELLFSILSAKGPITFSVNFAFDVLLSHKRDNSQVVNRSQFVEAVKQITATNPAAFELCDQGVGGTYFVKDRDGHKIAVFKPIDEEPGAPGNPKNRLTSPPLLPPGGGAIREVLAYSLDKGHAGVPETHLLEDFEHVHWMNDTGEHSPKTGSLQRFISHQSVAADMGASLFSVENVHKIGIFDIRVLNLDRNGENLLVVKEGDQFRLVPIDHSYILPESIQNPFFEWINWKQAKEPFSPEILKYISEMDVEEDSRLLRSFSVSEKSIRTMRAGTMLLKRGASAGLTLYQIASLVSVNSDTEPSELAKIVEQAESISCGCSGSFFSVFEKLVDELVCKCL